MEFVEYDKQAYHYLRMLSDAYRTWNFGKFYDSIAADCVFISDWNPIEIIWKKNVIKHYESISKFKSLWDIVYIHEKNHSAVVREIVSINWKDYFPTEKLDLEEWDLCLLETFVYWKNICDSRLIYISIDEDNLINLINETNYKRYIYEEFILPLNFNTMWNRRYPLYNEDNILSYQELCRASCVLADKILVDDFWYNIYFSKSMLNQSVNIVAEWEWKKVWFIISGFHSKDLREPWFNTPTGVLDRDVYEINLPDLRLRKFAKQYCDSIGAELNIIQFYFWSSNLEHRKKWLYCRWDSYEKIKYNWLFEDDFEC